MAFVDIGNLVCIVTMIVANVNADVYMHCPRGSNNRLKERSANRRNANRLFDSQNNNRGGYNVGDRGSDPAGTDETKQYQMKYFQSSIAFNNPDADKGLSFLPIEWTNQHGCGGNEDSNPNKLNCHVVLQYMCQQSDGNGAVPVTDKVSRIKDGTDTGTSSYTPPGVNENKVAFNTRKNRIKNGIINRGVQEPFEWYDKCTQRTRNKGLFIADQKVGERAKNTRQNPNGNRYGYECPEERDYYPYWHPNPWKDIAILAENASMCGYYQRESFNVKSRYECVEKWPGPNTEYKHYSRYNNQQDCEKAHGQWLEFHNYLEKAPRYTTEQACKNANTRNKPPKYIWGRPLFEMNKQCLVRLEAPTCREAPFSRDNHLGNGVDLEPMNYTWKLPYFPSQTQQRCVLRIRYNITTDDYDPYYTNSSHNRKYSPVVVPPIEQNPAIDVGANNVPLRLAINTAQYGRTFEDRSHVFLLEPRIRNGNAQVTNANGWNIYNLGVRGKRGNIVQVYPAVEYDFFPTNLVLDSSKDVVHIQWTGSNTHNNGAPGGDGQTGNDGEGNAGTDRNNMVPLKHRSQNFPFPMEDSSALWNNVIQVAWAAYGDKNTLLQNKLDIGIQFGSSGYYQCIEKNTKQCPPAESLEVKLAMNDLLNNAPASFPGMVLRLKAGEYHYMCSRNNNFSNRSQKGTIIVR